MVMFVVPGELQIAQSGNILKDEPENNYTYLLHFYFS
jgi:hypothetical protein